MQSLFHIALAAGTWPRLAPGVGGGSAPTAALTGEGRAEGRAQAGPRIAWAGGETGAWECGPGPAGALEARPCGGRGRGGTAVAAGMARVYCLCFPYCGTGHW